MQQSGVARRDYDADFEDDPDSKVHVLVHDLKPPFLDGSIAYTKQLEPINPVRDGTSDLAKFSKQGSKLVRERRERQERERAAAKAASVAGTTLGNLMGVKDEPDLGEGKSSFAFRSCLYKNEAHPDVQRARMATIKTIRQAPNSRVICRRIRVNRSLPRVVP